MSVVALQKACTVCGIQKPYADYFVKTNGRLFSECKACANARSLAIYHKNRDRYNTRNKTNANIVQPSGLTRRQEWALRSLYGLEASTYLRMYKQQGGKCACCEGPLELKDVKVDHDHATEKVRGLLCNDCNVLLGRAKDSVELLCRAIKYLKRRI
jgi:hypothetical protein